MGLIKKRVLVEPEFVAGKLVRCDSWKRFPSASTPEISMLNERVGDAIWRLRDKISIELKKIVSELEREYYIDIKKSRLEESDLQSLIRDENDGFNEKYVTIFCVEAVKKTEDQLYCEMVDFLLG